MLWQRRKGEAARPEWLIAGLGNPGMRHSNSRHNVGFEAARLLAKRQGIRLSQRRFKALYGCGEVEGVPVVIALPMTYMNRSGDAIKPLLGAYEIPPDRLAVVSDDMALPVGAIRIRLSGSSGGQKGLENIIQRLRTDRFARVRIGIDRPAPGAAVDYVLSSFEPEERQPIREAILRAAEAVEVLLRDGPDRAMNFFNRKPE